MAVSIYSSRIVLNALGVVDYGVYNYDTYLCPLSYVPVPCHNQTSYFSHQPSLRLYHHRDLIGSRDAFCKK